MRCIRCGLPLHRGRDGKCYYCKRKTKEAQAELDEWTEADADRRT